MKKMITVILTLAMLVTSITALAEAGSTDRGPFPGENTQMGRMPGMNDGNVMIDFDALAAEGVISQETLEKIKAFMKENRPADPAEKDGVGTEGNVPPSLPDMDGKAPEADDLLTVLLDNGVITQEEFDALTEALAEAREAGPARPGNKN